LDLPINHRIRFQRLFLIDQNGIPVGDIDTATAQARADAAELDLVVVSPQATPPVARILDFGKFKYEQERKDRKNKAKKTQEVKEIRLSYNTGSGDVDVKLNQAKRFLGEGHRIKLRLKLVGRENAFRDKAVLHLDQFRDLLGMEYDQPIQRQGKQLSVLLKEKKS
jgi:translation initiation factor IF-3